MATPHKTLEQLRSEYQATNLGPWHHDIEITPSVRTSDLSLESYNNNRHGFIKHEREAKEIFNIYGADMYKKSILDCACNAGAHLFECAKICGMEFGYGFDVRSMWIKQAIWAQDHITSYKTDKISLGVHGFDQLPRERFHVSFFNGIFYHLANPFLELTKVANLTTEIITINTACIISPDDVPPALIFKLEGKSDTDGLSGVEGVSWLPNGEEVLKELLRSLGFKYFKLVFKNACERPAFDRLLLIASKVPGLLR